MDLLLADLEALRDDPGSLPCTTMQVRWKRRWTDVPLLSSDKHRSIVTLYLYDATATVRSRASWRCDVDPLSAVEQFSEATSCEVLGVLQAGRAIAVDVGGTRFLAFYPISKPLRGPRLRS